jgi:hypothetical protein
VEVSYTRAEESEKGFSLLWQMRGEDTAGGRRGSWRVMVLDIESSLY